MKIVPTHWKGAPSSPRPWQASALESCLEAINAKERGVISAIMGAGKSILLAEIIASCKLERGEVIIVTCPTQALVKQLSATLMRRINPRDIGLFYAEFKHLRPIIVTCNDSMLRLGERVLFHGLKVALWIADEAHRTESPQVKAAAKLMKLDEVPALGLTATPFRSDRRERLSLWERLIYRYSAADAVADGAIVPWRVFSWTGDPETPLDECCVAMIREHLHRGPGVSNARNIKDAEAFAALLNASNVKASTVHSNIKENERTTRLAALSKGDLDVIVYVTMLAEGVNMPWLRWMCLRRKVGAEVRFAQEAGRITRADEGKSYGVILDPINLFSTMDFATREMVGVLDDSSPTPNPTPLEPPPPKAPEEPKTEQDKKKPPPDAVALTEVEAYLKQTSLSLHLWSLIDRRTTNDQRRRGIASTQDQKHAQELAKSKGVQHAADTTPASDRRLLRTALQQLQSLRHGPLNDLILILKYLADAAQWPDFSGAQPPPLSQHEEIKPPHKGSPPTPFPDTIPTSSATSKNSGPRKFFRTQISSKKIRRFSPQSQEPPTTKNTTSVLDDSLSSQLLDCLDDFDLFDD